MPAAMEVNRDEAERCIDIAAAALTNQQPDKAQRFLEKAQRLFPTEKAKGKAKWGGRAYSASTVRIIIITIFTTCSITCTPDEQRV